MKNLGFKVVYTAEQKAVPQINAITEGLPPLTELPNSVRLLYSPGLLIPNLFIIHDGSQVNERHIIEQDHISFASFWGEAKTMRAQPDWTMLCAVGSLSQIRAYKIPQQITTAGIKIQLPYRVPCNIWPPLPAWSDLHLSLPTAGKEEGYEAVSKQNRLFSCCTQFRLCRRHSKIVCKAVWNHLVFVSSCRSQQVAVIMKSLSGRVNFKKNWQEGSQQ